MTTLTLAQILQAYGPKVAGRASSKRRDPVERGLLLKAGDAQAKREDPALIKKAGERPKP
ncbi:MAG: hypothetical protein HYZ13_10075 [Acidobacteria bacterium]|nr:hypothetical protein [Acidobacteriota bacterium]